MIALAWIILLLTLVPLAILIWNWGALHAPPQVAGRGHRVSVLIHADDAAAIGPSVAAVLASRDVELELIVLDDGTSDGAARVAAEAASGDPRFRVEIAPPLPAGWDGRAHARHILSNLARFPWLVFLESGIALSPDALGRLIAFMDSRPIGLATGLVRGDRRSWLGRLAAPVADLLLLETAPLALLRRPRFARWGPARGALVVARAVSYRYVGGHAAIAGRPDDGSALGRAFRRKRIMTDLFDATEIARSAVGGSNRVQWAELRRQAAAESRSWPAIFQTLVLAAQLAPFLMAPAALAGTAPALIWAAVAASWLARALAALRCGHSWIGVLLHPLGLVIMLAIRLGALVFGGLAWHGRPVPAGG